MYKKRIALALLTCSAQVINGVNSSNKKIVRVGAGMVITAFIAKMVCNYVSGSTQRKIQNLIQKTYDLLKTLSPAYTALLSLTHDDLTQTLLAKENGDLFVHDINNFIEKLNALIISFTEIKLAHSKELDAQTIIAAHQTYFMLNATRSVLVNLTSNIEYRTPYTNLAQEVTRLQAKYKHEKTMLDGKEYITPQELALYMRVHIRQNYRHPADYYKKVVADIHVLTLRIQELKNSTILLDKPELNALLAQAESHAKLLSQYAEFCN